MKRAWLMLVVAANLAFSSTMALGADTKSGEQLSHLIDLTVESLNKMEADNKEIREWNKTHEDRLKAMKEIVDALQATYGSNARTNIDTAKAKIKGADALKKLHEKDDIRSIVDFIAFLDDVLKGKDERQEVLAYVQKVKDIAVAVKKDIDKKGEKDPIIQMRTIAHVPSERSDWPTVEKDGTKWKVTERKEKSTESVNDLLKTLRATRTLEQACLTPAAFEAEVKKIQALIDAQQKIIDVTVPAEIAKANGDALASHPVLLRKELDKHLSLIVRNDDNSKLADDAKIEVDGRQFTQQSLIEEVKNLITLEMLGKEYGSKVHPEVVKAANFIKDIPEGDVGDGTRLFNAFPTVKAFMAKVTKAKLKLPVTKFEADAVKDAPTKVASVIKKAEENAKPLLASAEAKKQAALAEIRTLQARIASLNTCSADRTKLDARLRGMNVIPSAQEAKEVHDGFKSINERAEEAIRPTAPKK